MRKVFGIIEGEQDRSRIFARVGEIVGREFLEAMAWLDRGGQRAPFRIPTVLRERWNLKPQPGV